MKQFERLRQVTDSAQRQQELPDPLAQRILMIAESLEQGALVADIDVLIEQISLYDTYGQTGYLGMGVNHVILTKTIEQIEQRL